jgi:hypothetical protein
MFDRCLIASGASVSKETRRRNEGNIPRPLRERTPSDQRQGSVASCVSNRLFLGVNIGFPPVEKPSYTVSA